MGRDKLITWKIEEDDDDDCTSLSVANVKSVVRQISFAAGVLLMAGITRWGVVLALALTDVACFSYKSAAYWITVKAAVRSPAILKTLASVICNLDIERKR